MATQQGYYQPPLRIGHSTVVINNNVYMWGGNQVGLPKVHDSKKKRRMTCPIEIFNITDGTWKTKLTTGKPPLGVDSYACTSVRNRICFFGGLCHHDNCYHNSLNELNVESLQWKQLSPTDDKQGLPIKKASCGMVSFTFNNEDVALIIGGKGSPTKKIQLNATYVTLPSGNLVTNEHHMYNFSTGKWSSPTISGQCPSPCAAFTLTTTSSNTAVLYGGQYRDHDGTCGLNDNVYTVEMAGDTVHWIRLAQSHDPWPKGRLGHTTAVICDPLLHQSCTVMIVIGGARHDGTILNDSWVYDFTAKKWQQLNLAQSVTFRIAPSLSVFTISSHCVWLVVFGGRDDNGDSRDINVVELVYDNEWIVGELLTPTELSNTQEYQQLLWKRKREGQTMTRKKVMLQQQLQISLEDSLQLQRRNYELKEEIGQLKQKGDQLKEENCQLQKENGELQQEILQLQQIRQQENHQHNEEIHKLKQENQKSLQQLQKYQREAPQLCTQQEYWAVMRGEITMTTEVLGKGGYGEVRVAMFRGLRVAAKCLHEVILSPYNLQLFTREMEMAARIRHPNLVQFIGATKEGSPIILSELMLTNLRKELEKAPLSHPDILCISIDIAAALNYLHLCQPSPIIHRDVSSPNILLEPSSPNRWKAKLSDYGSANLVQQISTKSVAPGNPVYSAPEAYNPDHHSPAMDVYSYGVLLTEMVLCCPPGFTTTEREQLSLKIEWLPIQSLASKCIVSDYQSRPNIAAVLQQLKKLQN